MDKYQPILTTVLKIYALVMLDNEKLSTPDEMITHQITQLFRELDQNKVAIVLDQELGEDGDPFFEGAEVIIEPSEETSGFGLVELP